MLKLTLMRLIIVIMVVLIESVLLALGGIEDRAEGKFRMRNVPPEPPTFTLYERDRRNVTTNMIPQVEFALRIDAQDLNSLDEIQEIIVYIYYGGSDTDAEPSTDDPKTQATYKWVKGVGWELVGPKNSTWGINKSASVGPINTTSTSGTWWLHFIPGKVATETDKDTTWIIKVVVIDKWNTSNSTKQANYTMAWYGEIQALDESFDFGNVSLGEENDEIDIPADHNIDVKTISNGYHCILAKTDERWTCGNNSVILHTINDKPGDGEIMLKHSGYPFVRLSNTVKPYYEIILGLEYLEQTDEEGSIHEIYLWLSVGKGIRAGTYSGYYYIMISNVY